MWSWEKSERKLMPNLLRCSFGKEQRKITRPAAGRTRRLRSRRQRQDMRRESWCVWVLQARSCIVRSYARPRLPRAGILELTVTKGSRNPRHHGWHLELRDGTGRFAHWADTFRLRQVSFRARMEAVLSLLVVPVRFRVPTCECGVGGCVHRSATRGVRPVEQTGKWTATSIRDNTERSLFALRTKLQVFTGL